MISHIMTKPIFYAGIISLELLSKQLLGLPLVTLRSGLWEQSMLSHAEEAFFFLSHQQPCMAKITGT